jgi:fucose permease
MGGGFVSVFQGYLSDESLLGIRHSYWVGVVCFAYLAYYGSYMLKNKTPVVENSSSKIDLIGTE